MTAALTTGTRLLVIQEIEEDATGATLHFQEGRQGRLAFGNGDYAIHLRLARRSQERRHPLGVGFGDGQTIASLTRADNDVPTKLWEEDQRGARALFQGHDGVFRLNRDHPEFYRIRALLAEAIEQKARVWFIAQKPELALLDVVPAEPRAPGPPVSKDGSSVLSVLATAIYEILRSLVPNSRAEITYTELVTRLGPMLPNEDLRPRDPRLDAALGELVTACRQRGLPVISAMVVREDDRTPGAGYYNLAHPEVANDTARAMIAWGQEVQQVRGTRYPVQL